MELWRECICWFVSCSLLPKSHRLTLPQTRLVDVFQSLRDGVLLCHLIYKLDALAINMSLVSQRPQLAQFLCLKNIRLFLQSCKNFFDMKEIDLFDPFMLFEGLDFRMVLETLSKLSHSSKVQKKGIKGFPSSDYRTHDDIYKNLENIANSYTYEDLNDSCSVTYGNSQIYEDLCASHFEKHSILNQLPVDKQDLCIKELVESEGNYLEVLNTIVQKFIEPLKVIDSVQEDLKIMFFGIKEMHKLFHAELIKHNVSSSKVQSISTVIIKWKIRFIIYSEFCANLPKAQRLLDECCNNHESFNECLHECHMKANRGKFHLRDLLSIPVQRVLKYHLLLENLMKNTPVNTDDYTLVEQAHDAMVDISEYINEFKRDVDSLQNIDNILSSIQGCDLPNGIKFNDYGRLQKDGDLKVRSHEKNRMKSRYIFLFSKVLLITKIKGDEYKFKALIHMQQHTIEEIPSKREKWGYIWLLVPEDKTNAYTFAAKNEENCNQWKKAMANAIEIMGVYKCPNTQHELQCITFKEAVSCCVCQRFLKGAIYQGYLCCKCCIAVHRSCIPLLCNVCTSLPSVPPRHNAEESDDWIIKLQSAEKLKSTAEISSTSLNHYQNILLQQYPWFVGDMERCEAESLLKHTPNGCFLLRNNVIKDFHAISVNYNGFVRHMKVLHNEENLFYLSVNQIFNSEIELIQYYMHHSLKEIFCNLNTTLRIPFKKLHLITNDQHKYSIQTTCSNFKELQKLHTVNKQENENELSSDQEKNRIEDSIKEITTHENILE